jgi:hypothetical protein
MTAVMSDKTSRFREVEVEVRVAVEVGVAVGDGDKGFKVAMDPAPPGTTMPKLHVNNLSSDDLGLMLRDDLTQRRRHKLVMA